MKVYIIYETCYEDFEVLGVFDNKQKAEALSKKYKMYCEEQASIFVAEYILNQFTQKTVERILLSFDKLKQEMLGDE